MCFAALLANFLSFKEKKPPISMYTHFSQFFAIFNYKKSSIGINTYTLTLYKLKIMHYTIKYITIAYISKLLKLLIFSKNIIFFLSWYNIKMVELTRKEHNIIAKNWGIMEPQNMSTQELLNTLIRYDSRRKVNSNCRKLLKIKLEKIAKIQNISKNELNKA